MLEQLKSELPKYKHQYTSEVYFHNVDSVGVVHNVQYFYFLEVAHTEYFKNLGISINKDTFSREIPLMVVHNEIDYYLPLTLGEKFSVLSRISWYKNSSFEFQSIVLNSEDEIVAFSKKVLVHYDPNTQQTVPLPNNLIELFKNFEGKNILKKH